MNINFNNQDQFTSIVGNKLDGWWIILTTLNDLNYEGYATVTDTGITLINDNSQEASWKWDQIAGIEVA